MSNPPSAKLMIEEALEAEPLIMPENRDVGTSVVIPTLPPFPSVAPDSFLDILPGVRTTSCRIVENHPTQRAGVYCPARVIRGERSTEMLPVISEETAHKMQKVYQAKIRVAHAMEYVNEIYMLARKNGRTAVEIVKLRLMWDRWTLELAQATAELRNHPHWF
jgi:hypothetical protein